MHERSILVTGATGEIGSSLIREFLKDGWIVCGLDLRGPANIEGAGYYFAECDLSNGLACERRIADFHEKFGAFDAVVNCAALIANSPLLSFSEGRLVHHDFGLWNRVLSSSLTAAFHVTACTVLKMAEARKRGVILNISSICSRGNPGQAAYSSAKAGLNGLTTALAKELGAIGIRVVAIAPGYIETTSTAEHVPAAKLKAIKASVPLNRLGKVEEVISAVKFVLANEYVNGTIIELNGGQVL